MSEKAAQGGEGRQLLGQILKARGVLKEGQIQTALGEQRKGGGLIGQCMVDMGACSQGDVAMALGEQAGMETVDLSAFTPDAEVLALVDGSACHTYGVLPLRLDAGQLVVAIADPLNTAVLEDLSFTTGTSVRGAVADGEAIKRLVTAHYGEERSLADAIAEAAAAVDGGDAESAAQSMPVVRLLNSILHRATQDRARHSGCGRPKRPQRCHCAQHVHAGAHRRLGRGTIV